MNILATTLIITMCSIFTEGDCKESKGINIGVTVEECHAYVGRLNKVAPRMMGAKVDNWTCMPTTKEQFDDPNFPRHDHRKNKGGDA